ncbi:MAG: tetratricopeptide repeat protein, partial [Wohlfahrtiimonas sp.]
MKKMGLALLVSCVLSSQVFAAEVNFQQLLNERNIDELQSVIKKEPNNGEAYYVVSLYYSVGDDELGTNKDEMKRYEYLKKSADLGFAEAQLQYGFYLLNQGKPADGMIYIQKSADNQYLPAITLLGDLYFAGYQDEDGNVVINKDIELAVQYLEKAVVQHNQDARYTLGHIYLSPDFEKQDIAKALELFEANIDYKNKVGHLATLITLIDMYNEGKDVVTNRAKLLDYYYLASLQDYQSAYYVIGMAQRVGEKGEKIDIAKDLEAAFDNLNKAASVGYIDAMFRIGEMYFKGEGTEQSDMNAYI